MGMEMGMNDLTQALAERAAGWEQWVWQCRANEWVATARKGDQQAPMCYAPTPAGAVRMLNEALREAGK